MTSIAHEFTDDRFSLEFFCEEMDRLIRFCEERVESVCVAVSGGSDSVSLLFMVAQWAGEKNIQVRCLTVDHKLRNESREEAEFVGDLCQSLGIIHTILDWNRNNAAVEEGKLENLAREARYRLMSEYCERNAIPVLLTGHTWNDQLETFEMRKSAGSSPSGLAGMSQVRSLTDRVKLLRPVLHFSRKHLENFLKHRRISWKSDPMNNQDFFLRVAHRKRILGYGMDKISEISEEIIRLGKRRNEIETPAVRFLKKFCDFSRPGCAIVEKKSLLLEDKSVRAEILKRVIWNIGGKKYAATVTEDLCDQILDKKINTLGRCLLKVKKNHILVVRENRRGKSAIPPNHCPMEERMPLGLPWEEQNHRMTDGSPNGPLKVNLFDVFL